MRQIILGDITIGGEAPFVLISGPCVIEDGVKTEQIALYLKNLAGELNIPFYLQGIL